MLAWVVEGIQLYHEDPAWIPACMAAYEDNMTGELGKGAIGDMFEMTGFVPMDEKVKVADGVPIRWLREAYKVAADLRSAPFNGYYDSDPSECRLYASFGRPKEWYSST